MFTFRLVGIFQHSGNTNDVHYLFLLYMLYRSQHIKYTQSIGATKLGQQYLLSKAMIQASAALNLVMYLLLKAEQAENAGTNMVDPALIQSHPVMQHLEKLNSLCSKIEEGVEKRVPGLIGQLETLAKAAASLNDPSLMQDSDDSDRDDGNENDSENDKGNEDVEGGAVDLNRTDTSNMLPGNIATLESKADDDNDDDDDETSVDEDIARRITLNDARFGLRPNEMQNLRQTNAKIEQRRKNMMYSDAGDDDIEDDIERKKRGQSLATILNTVEQRSSTNQNRSKRSSQQLVEHIDDQNDEDGDGELRRGLEMMEEALGAPSDDDEEKDEQYDPELDGHDDYDNGGDDFYSKMMEKSKVTKDERKQRYAVAPKFPRVENDIVGDRTASKQILKNRGLVAHKAKINRNPRVKHREKFRQANKRRAGAVQAIRSPSEGHNYGGEATGISTNVVRSRKLA
jgi:U3 small nucleolar RNA-associated protein 3